MAIHFFIVVLLLQRVQARAPDRACAGALRTGAVDRTARFNNHVSRVRFLTVADTLRLHRNRGSLRRKGE
jgi:hypothetical protein